MNASERVVVLGAGGFVGKALCRQLDTAGFSILPVYRSEADLSASDCVDKLASWIRPTDKIVMLAALTPDKGRDIATLMKNLAMMQHVCVAVTESGCAHFTYFSSDAVYDSALSLVNEETPASPQDLYGVMHYAREIMAKTLSKVPVLILRPTMIYGLGDTHNSYGVNRFRRSAKKDKEIVLFGEGDDVRDHIHIDDVVSLTIRCLIENTVGVMNLVTGVSRTFYEVAELVSKSFQEDIKIHKLPRGNSASQRYYDITKLIKTFPDFKFKGEIS